MVDYVTCPPYEPYNFSCSRGWGCGDYWLVQLMWMVATNEN